MKCKRWLDVWQAADRSHEEATPSATTNKNGTAGMGRSGVVRAGLGSTCMSSFLKAAGGGGCETGTMGAGTAAGAAAPAAQGTSVSSLPEQPHAHDLAVCRSRSLLTALGGVPHRAGSCAQLEARLLLGAAGSANTMLSVRPCT